MSDDDGAAPVEDRDEEVDTRGADSDVCEEPPRLRFETCAARLDSTANEADAGRWMGEAGPGAARPNIADLKLKRLLATFPPAPLAGSGPASVDVGVKCCL